MPKLHKEEVYILEGALAESKAGIRKQQSISEKWVYKGCPARLCERDWLLQVSWCVQKAVILSRNETSDNKQPMWADWSGSACKCELGEEEMGSCCSHNPSVSPLVTCQFLRQILLMALKEQLDLPPSCVTELETIQRTAPRTQILRWGPSGHSYI